MSSKNQTAVEFLIDEIRNCIKENGRLDAITISKLKMQAKAMEKEQIGNAYVKGQSDCDMFTMESEVEQYYNDTFL
jgi:hypothetical protein